MYILQGILNFEPNEKRLIRSLGRIKSLAVLASKFCLTK